MLLDVVFTKRCETLFPRADNMQFHGTKWHFMKQLCIIMFAFIHGAREQ